MRTGTRGTRWAAAVAVAGTTAAAATAGAQTAAEAARRSPAADSGRRAVGDWVAGSSAFRDSVNAALGALPFDAGGGAAAGPTGSPAG
jgi:hypothetical protein